MCGRFALLIDTALLARRFNAVLGDVDERGPQRNASPTQVLPVVSQRGMERVLTLMKWGLVPHWAKDPSIGAKMINARSETVLEKPSFRQAFARRRCLVPACGFYEWKRAAARSGKSAPFFFHVPERPLIGFAGLWEHWAGVDGGEIVSFTILTTEANEMVRAVHHRMPAILEEKDEERWLTEPAAKSEALVELLRPYPAERMACRAASPYGGGWDDLFAGEGLAR